MREKTAKNDTPQTVLDLVARFDTHRDAYKSPEYNETQIRREFIDPFFTALGWDVENKQGYAEQWKEVIHEDALKVGGATKAPDYSFRLGGRRLFFLEAKKPSVNLREDPGPAYQLRRYAWTAKLPLSILTDFEEFIVYDTRIRPAVTDTPAKARILYIRCEDYIERWHEIAAIFSPEAIRKGAFDKYVESVTQKRGTAEVDDAFLGEIEEWRADLARNIAVRNPGLTERELNFAVQHTIDRIIFLRICEDRGVETYGHLQALLNGSNVYARLRELFYKADERYNSGLFHFEKEKNRPGAPDELTPRLAIDDKVLKDIFRRLYYPECPYEFSVMPAEVLGHVYERFLGSVIRLTAGGHAKVEQKPEVRKAGGVYYTPTYIVDYIVKHAVGRLLEGKTPQEVAGVTSGWRPAKNGRHLAILDPACGSGSFLLGAYQFLLDWHLEHFGKNPEKWSKGREPKLYLHHRGGWRLTTSERKRILLANIFGVDIDAQAVEVTKLSLLLKVLEGESAETIQMQLRLFHERALPDLDANIKCGNSLIGPDFYKGRQQDLFDEKEMYRVNAFDWKAEFSEIMRTGGFDAVIGNPPYLFITEVPSYLRRYFEAEYHGVSYRFDLYGAFIERALTLLLRRGGVFGFIIPHTLLSNDSFKQLRILLAKAATICEVLDFGPGVFRGARNETMLLFFRSEEARPADMVSVIRTSAKAFPSELERFAIPQHEWILPDGSPWLVSASPVSQRLIKRMESAKHRLGDLCTANQGLRTGNNPKYLSGVPKSRLWKVAAGGKQIGRYEPIPLTLFVYYEPSVLDAPRRPEIFFSKCKIIVQEIRNIALKRRIVATLDRNEIIGLQSTNVINLKASAEHDIRYVLGILNSRATNHYFRLVFPGNNHIPSSQLLRIPVPEANKNIQDRVAHLADRMLDLHKRLAAARTQHESTLLERQIAATDREIDQLVYELYGLTKEEIALVEEATEKS